MLLNSALTSLFLSTPSARRATQLSSVPVAFERFLSTPSARRATVFGTGSEGEGSDFYPRPPRGGRRCTARSFRAAAAYFYPRPPRGGRLHLGDVTDHGIVISIHALREEGDLVDNLQDVYSKNFYPRPPRGGRPTCSTTWRPATRFLSTPSARRATADLQPGGPVPH